MDNKKTDQYYELEFVNSEMLDIVSKQLATLSTFTISTIEEYIKVEKFELIKNSIKANDVADLNRRAWAMEIIDHILLKLSKLKEIKSKQESTTKQ